MINSEKLADIDTISDDQQKAIETGDIPSHPTDRDVQDIQLTGRAKIKQTERYLKQLEAIRALIN